MTMGPWSYGWYSSERASSIVVLTSFGPLDTRANALPALRQALADLEAPQFCQWFKGCQKVSQGLFKVSGIGAKT